MSLYGAAGSGESHAPIECLACGAIRVTIVHTHENTGECPRCGYLGWAFTDDLVEATLNTADTPSGAETATDMTWAGGLLAQRSRLLMDLADRREAPHAHAPVESPLLRMLRGR